MLNPISGGRIIRGSIVAIMTIALASGTVHAQKSSPVLFKVTKATGNAAKISSVLGDVLEQSKTSAKPSALSNTMVKINNDGAVQAYVQVTDCSKAVIASLQALGLKVELVNARLKTIQGWLPLSALQTVAANPAVTAIKTPGYRKLRAGSVMTEGDAVIKANYPRLSGARGTGVTIGLISDGVDNRASSQATGDLPASIDIDPSHPGSGDAGTALLEIVHDVAPLASLAFSGPTTSLEFIDSLNYLVTVANCNVIFDDMGFYDQPYFEDGPVAQAVAALPNTITYLSAAGNDAQFHYLATYTDVDPGNLGGTHDFHAFSGTDVSMQVLIPGYSTVEVSLEWNDSWGHAGDDYDLFLYNQTLTSVLAKSTDAQTGSSNPYEGLFYTNKKSTPVIANILINKFQGAAKRLEMFVSGAQEIQFATPAGSIFGHTSLPNVISVGAVSVYAPTTIDSYSSQGSRGIYFPTVVTRGVPTLVAPDGVSITGAGGLPLRFYGTSAAVAHAAGVAALVIGAHPSYTATDVMVNLKNTATDMGAAGWDTIYGRGMINADAAVNLAHNAVKFWNEFR